MRYVALAVIVFVSLASAPSVTEAVGPQAGEGEQCLALINAYRAVWGAGPLVPHPALEAEARRHIWEEKKYKYIADYGIGQDGVSIVSFGERACTSSNPESDPATDPGYPCTTYDEFFDPNTIVTGWVSGVNAKGFREARALCSENGWMNPNDHRSDELTIRNPNWVHGVVVKSGDYWSFMAGWPASP
jgi:hypothetical protein